MAFWGKDKNKDKKLRQQRKDARAAKEYQGERQTLPVGERLPPISRKDRGW